MPIENPTAKLAPIMDEAFKYQVGQQVVWRACVTATQQEAIVNAGYKTGSFSGARSINRPILLHISERLMQQCHGGVQLQYTVTCPGITGGEQPRHAMEHALAAVEEWQEAALALAQVYRPKDE